jgi:hypothetical protein
MLQVASPSSATPGKMARENSAQIGIFYFERYLSGFAFSQTFRHEFLKLIQENLFIKPHGKGANFCG